MEIVDYEAGQTIFAEGESGRHCFRLVSGLVEIRLRNVESGEETALVRIRPGEGPGLLGLNALWDQPYAFSAVAIEATTCTRHPAEDAADLLRAEPEWLQASHDNNLSQIDYFVAQYPDAGFCRSSALRRLSNEALIDLLRDEPDAALAYLRMLGGHLDDIHREVRRIIDES